MRRAVSTVGFPERTDRTAFALFVRLLPELDAIDPAVRAIAAPRTAGLLG
jgi:hypothetical protein